MGSARIFFGYVPHIVFVILIYNLLVIGAGVFSGVPGPNPMQEFLASALFRLTSMRRESWVISLGDLLVILGIVALSEEVIRAANVTKVEIVNHGLSIGVFVFALIEFLLIKGFSTATFMILCFLSLVDTVAGFTIALLAARRGVEVSEEVKADGGQGL